MNTKLIHRPALAISIVSLLTIGACSTMQPSTPVSSETLAGSWYGDSRDGDEHTLWLNQRRTDNTFTLTFKKCIAGKETFYQVKEGNWTSKDSTYTTITNQLKDRQQTWYPATPNRKYIEKYTINNLKNNVLSYNSEDGKSYKAYKVDPAYALDCNKAPEYLPAAIIKVQDKAES